VISADSLPVYQPHPEDLELDNEPTLFEQVMNAADSSDSENEGGDEEEEEEKEVEETEETKKDK
jgi:translocation protein SEC63